MFKEKFKYYKSKKHSPSLQDVIDLKNSNMWYSKIRKLKCDSSSWKNDSELKNPQTWEIFELVDNPGLIFIRNPFTSFGQRYWTIRCLRDFPFPPNRTNLRDKCFDLSLNEKAEIKLRWSTLGYHHNWDTKEYSEEMKSDFPQDLAKLSKCFAEILGFVDFKAEAAIVNYYYSNSTLSGHTDHSEENLEAPLFSFSFGQSAIFLLGGKTLEEKPEALLIRSGDVIIMTKESRLCYHGVPKILIQNDYSSWNDIETRGELDEDISKLCYDEKNWLPYDEFLKNGRININLRQVLYNSQYCLN